MGEPKLEGVKTALKICQGIKIGGQCPNSCPLLAACQMGCGGAPRMILDCIQYLEAERDAAVADIRFAFTSYVGACQTCKHGENQVDCIEPLRCQNCENGKCKCQSCDSDYSNWEWRGVQKEE